MLLKIILVIVFLKILIDILWITEGLTVKEIINEVNNRNEGEFSLTEEVALQSMGQPKKPNHCNVNIVFPSFEVNKEYPNIDPETKKPKMVGSFPDGEDLFHSFQNINKYAKPENCDNIISA
jgi:hypothetical protein